MQCIAVRKHPASCIAVQASDTVYVLCICLNGLRVLTLYHCKVCLAAAASLAGLCTACFAVGGEYGVTV
jgi:hypothetical protein